MLGELGKYFGKKNIFLSKLSALCRNEAAPRLYDITGKPDSLVQRAQHVEQADLDSCLYSVTDSLCDTWGSHWTSALSSVRRRDWPCYFLKSFYCFKIEFLGVLSSDIPFSCFLLIWQVTVNHPILSRECELVEIYSLLLTL